MPSKTNVYLHLHENDTSFETELAITDTEINDVSVCETESKAFYEGSNLNKNTIFINR